MTYAGLQLFMNNLKELIYCKDNPLIINSPSILYETPQFQQLYEELCPVIQIFFIDQDQDEKVRNLKKRFKQAAIDLFLSNVHFRNKGRFTRFSVVKRSLDLEEVIKSIKSIKVEFAMITNNKMGSPQVSDQSQIIIQSASAAESSCTRKSLGMMKVSEETVVGLDHHAELIRDKLAEDRKQLDVISIVGMGGLDLDKASHSRLREVLYKSLKGKRYLILVDDIWSSETWDEVKRFFPNDDTGSRILLTSRLNEVALHAIFGAFKPSLLKQILYHWCCQVPYQTWSN
ncbi:unnamed protein product [Lactuca virosa]|uniref:NB-ARC domain-containing protein n=1 Tax=Lactuca virosa TaxID=75947 RepID=A0AAU9LSQ0_9ASTR|nr:unnamed protein product [Lactuca virosa]